MNEREMKEAYMSALTKKAPKGMLDHYHAMNSVYQEARAQGRFPDRTTNARQTLKPIKNQLNQLETKMILMRADLLILQRN